MELIRLLSFVSALVSIGLILFGSFGLRHFLRRTWGKGTGHV